jgi:hypothetical protein
LQRELMEEQWRIEDLMAPDVDARARTRTRVRSIDHRSTQRANSLTSSHLLKRRSLSPTRSLQSLPHTNSLSNVLSSHARRHSALVVHGSPQALMTPADGSSAPFTASSLGASGTTPSPAPSGDASPPTPGLGFARRKEALFFASYNSFRKLLVPGLHSSKES